jgi:hypothetical protein
MLFTQFFAVGTILIVVPVRIRLEACPGPDPVIYLTAYRDPSPAGFTIILEETILHVFFPFLQLPKRIQIQKSLINADPCGLLVRI